jgi:hypothetical protein
MTKDQYDEISEKCTNKTVEAAPNGGHRVWVWHPQWGGYRAHATADFGEVTGCADGEVGCFELAVYHDGEFPRDEPLFFRHCCSALQFATFGLDIYEAMLVYQSRDPSGLTNKPSPRMEAVLPSTVELWKLKERIDALLAAYSEESEGEG